MAMQNRRQTIWIPSPRDLPMRETTGLAVYCAFGSTTERLTYGQSRPSIMVADEFSREYAGLIAHGFSFQGRRDVAALWRFEQLAAQENIGHVIDVSNHNGIGSSIRELLTRSGLSAGSLSDDIADSRLSLLSVRIRAVPHIEIPGPGQTPVQLGADYFRRASH